MVLSNLSQWMNSKVAAVIIAAVVSGLSVWGINAPLRVTATADKPTVETPTKRPAGIADPATVTDERNNIEVYRASAPGIVFITTAAGGRNFFDSEEREGSGSGVVIDEQGHILTNEHVVAGASRVTVKLTGDRTYPARVVGSDPDTDLAVLKIEAPREQLTVIPMANSDQLTVGQKVLAIGNPFGLDRTLTTGVISGLQRPIRTRNNRLIEGAIQTDASINPGNSGGALLDSQGRLIGINTMIYSPSGGSVGVGFAIPTNIAKRIVPELVSNGRVMRPRLGIGVQSISQLRGQVRLPLQEGLIVMQVAPGGPADQAGLRGLSRGDYGDTELGDIIVAVDGKPVKEMDDLTRILDQHKIGDEIEIEVVRNGRHRTVKVKLNAPPQQPQEPRQVPPMRRRM